MSTFEGAAATGDEFKDLYLQLMRWAHLLGVAADDIDDVVQTTCVEVWRRAQDHEIENLERYAWVALRHAWFARLRAAQRWSSLVVSGDVLLHGQGDGVGFEELADESADVEEQVWQQEQLAEVKRLLAGFPPRDQLIILGLVEGKTIPELARELGISERMVRGIAKRARAHLHKPLIILDEFHMFGVRHEQPDPLPGRGELEALDWHWEWVSEVHRQVLELRIRQGLSVAQIAAQLHYSEGTVRCYLSRGKREAEAPQEPKQRGRPRQEAPACWEWISQVTPTPQRVLRLYYEQRLSTAAIAESEEMTVENVRVMLKQGRRELQRLGRSTPAVPGCPRMPLTPLQQQYPERASGVYLSPFQRDVWKQYYKEGKTTHVIAGILKIPEGTVKSCLRRARETFANSAAG